MSQGVGFTPKSARRISRVVQEHEADRGHPLGGDSIAAAGGIAKPFRICYTSTAIAKGASAAIPFHNDPAGKTLPVHNPLGDIQANSIVFVAQATDGNYYAIAAECP